MTIIPQCMAACFHCYLDYMGVAQIEELDHQQQVGRADFGEQVEIDILPFC